MVLRPEINKSSFVLNTNYTLKLVSPRPFQKLPFVIFHFPPRCGNHKTTTLKFMPNSELQQLCLPQFRLPNYVYKIEKKF